MSGILEALSPKALERLQAMVHITNVNQETNLTLEEWIILHLKELAVTQELGQHVEALQEKAKGEVEKKMTRDYLKLRDKLIDALG